jgi:hypothetical protein
MKLLKIEPTKLTPAILLDPNNNNFEFSGFSLPENAIDFYQPFIDIITNYKSELNTKSKDKTVIKVSFKLSYFNSASTRLIVQIFELFSEMHKAGYMTDVIWYYDSEDSQMAELGKEFGEITKLPVQIIAYS